MPTRRSKQNETIADDVLRGCRVLNQQLFQKMIGKNCLFKVRETLGQGDILEFKILDVSPKGNIKFQHARSMHVEWMEISEFAVDYIYLETLP